MKNIMKKLKTLAVLGMTMGLALGLAAADIPLSPRGTKPVRVTADSTLTQSLRNELAKKGARVIAAVGPRSVLVEVTPAVAQGISEDSRFTTADILPAAKIQKNLSELCAAAPSDPIPVAVVALSEEDVSAISAAIVLSGGEIVQGPYEKDTLGAKVKPALVTLLSERGDVRWIEHAPPTRVLSVDYGSAGAANTDAARTQHDLLGRGETVTICDTGFDRGSTNHTAAELYGGRVRALLPEAGFHKLAADYNGHGTHVAGLMIQNSGCGSDVVGWHDGCCYYGYGDPYYDITRIAPKAGLVMECAGCGESDELWIVWPYSRLFTEGLREYGSYIHSDGWGSATNGIYNTQCAAVDQVLWANPELLVVFASGNSGALGDGFLATPGTAKGALTVGNAQSFANRSADFGLPASPECLNPTSSRGPTADGRIKPEITAPGTAIGGGMSVYAAPLRDDDTRTGTSIACAVVSGAAALIREWLFDRRDYKAHHGGKLPTGALMKAIITGGGVVMTGDYADAGNVESTRKALPQTRPNACTGWGRIDLENTLYPADGRNVIFADRIPFSEGSVWVTNITTSADNALDVQLAWTDYPADASVDRGATLINDLDLIVSNKTTGAVWYGNGIEGGDHTNTVESVRIAAAGAPAGEYAVIVRGHVVPFDSTEGGAAAVYVRGAFENETAPDPLVRNVRTGKTYELLDAALREVQSGDTLEVSRPVKLVESVTVPASCTIATTMYNPANALVKRENGACMAIAADQSLTLSNIVFVADAAQPVVDVASGAKLKLTGKLGIGKIRTADATGIELCGSLALVDGCDIFIDSDNSAADAQFGTFSCAFPDANAAANLFSNARNADLGGVADSATGQLKWGSVSIPTSNATAVVTTESSTNGYRTLEAALKAAVEKDAQITIRRNLTLTNTVELSHSLTLASAEGAVLSFGREAAFVIPTGVAMTLQNVTVSGTGAALTNCAFLVNGGDLTLAAGAKLADFTDDDHGVGKPWGGAIVVSSGTVTMQSRSIITNCVAHTGGFGGAIYLGGSGATANLLGGMITDCSAARGGAVYAAGNETAGAAVNVAGDFTATDNTCTTDASAVPGNLHLFPKTVFTLTGVAKGAVGVSFESGSPDLNAQGANFMAADSGISDSLKAWSAHLFSNDSNAELIGGCKDGKIVWVPRPVDGQCPGESYAGVRVKVVGERDYRYYWCIDEAFEHVKEDATFEVKGFVSGDTARLDMLSKDATIDHDVRITSWDGFTYNESDIMILWRTCHAMYKVVAGGSLTLANVKIVGACSYGSGYSPWDDDADNAFTPLFYEDTDPENPVNKPSKGVGLISVDGGSLTLENGARVGFVLGKASGASNAITVFNGGTVTMESGSRVMEVYSQYRNDFEISCGGGILLDHATGYFKGGLIYHCKAYRAGGLYVANGSTAYLSGDIYIGQNYDYKYDGEDNVIVMKNSKLVLAGPLASVDPDDDDGYIGVNEDIKLADSNCFATVEWEWTDFNELETSARYFCHDIRTLAEPVYDPEWREWDYIVYGTAVKNGSEALLVWEDSLKTNERGHQYYEDENGKRYDAVARNMCAQADAGVRAWVAGEKSPRYYDCLDTALDCVYDDATIETSGFRKSGSAWVEDAIKWDARIATGIVLKPWVEHPQCGSRVPQIWRDGDVRYMIATNGSLTVSNVTICGAQKIESGSGVYTTDLGLVCVDGGVLTLGEGAAVGCVPGAAESRAWNAIAVTNGGTFTMLAGSAVTNAQLIVDGPSAGRIGAYEGANGDSNLCAIVTWDWSGTGEPQDFAKGVRDCANGFVHEQRRVAAIPATNGTVTVFVWTDAVASDAGGRCYVGEDGTRYGIVDYSIVNPPPKVDNASVKVYVNDGIEVDVGSGITVAKDTPAYAVYTAENGHYFADGATVLTNGFDTSVNPAAAVAPAAPAVPSVKVGKPAQRYPWNGIVNVPYRVKNWPAGGDGRRVKFTVRVGETTVDGGAITPSGGTVTGTYAIDFKKLNLPTDRGEATVKAEIVAE